MPQHPDIFWSKILAVALGGAPKLWPQALVCITPLQPLQNQVCGVWASTGIRERQATFCKLDVTCLCSGPNSNMAFFGIVLRIGVRKTPKWRICIPQNPNSPTKYRASYWVLGLSKESGFFIVTCGVSRVAPAWIMPKNFTIWASPWTLARFGNQFLLASPSTLNPT